MKSAPDTSRTSACMPGAVAAVAQQLARFELGGLLHELSGPRDGLGDAPLVLARSRVSL